MERIADGLLCGWSDWQEDWSCCCHCLLDLLLWRLLRDHTLLSHQIRSNAIEEIEALFFALQTRGAFHHAVEAGQCGVDRANSSSNCCVAFCCLLYTATMKDANAVPTPREQQQQNSAECAAHDDAHGGADRPHSRVM